MFESACEPMLTPRQFAIRLMHHVALAQLFVFSSILIGMAGFRLTEGLGWTDGFLEAAMLLGGMGPVHAPATEAGKLFDGFFALYAGLLFIAVGGFVLAPVLHRVLHKLHVDDAD